MGCRRSRDPQSRRRIRPITQQTDETVAEHRSHDEDPSHEHGAKCGHETVVHDDHVDDVHDGHRHAVHETRHDEH